MSVRYFLWRNRGWRDGWLVRYLASPYGGDYAEIARDDGHRMYLYRGAVEGWEPLWGAIDTGWQSDEKAACDAAKGLRCAT